MTIKVIYSEEFYRAARKLQRRFPHLLDDVDALSDQLEKGYLLGDRLQGLPYKVFKTRLKNTDAHRGKSGGYRVLYYLETEEQTVLLTIYSKSDQSDIPTHIIRRIIEAYEAGGR